MLSFGPAAPPDGALALLRSPPARRLFLLASFVALLYVFRHLIPLFVFFIAFQRLLSVAASQLERRARVPRKLAVLLPVLAFLAALGTALALGLGRAIQAWFELRDDLPARIESLRALPWVHALEEQLQGVEGLVERTQHYATSALGYLATAGHLLIHLVIGFLLAVIYEIERDDLADTFAKLAPTSIAGTLGRWLGHVADALSVTLQFQAIVAACNALLTLPVLLIVGIPHAGAFLFMVFFSGLVPVVGNVVAGAVLTLLAWQAKGWFGVALFTGLTFVLHKIEGYYLTPRLAARHVKLPAFAMILSLIVWEHLAGFVGLFLSFPFLFIANRLREEFALEDASAARDLAITAPPEPGS